jgi:hypothetical protein
MMAFRLFESSLKLTKVGPRELDCRCRLDSTHPAFSRQRRKKRFGRIQMPACHQAANRANVTQNFRRQPWRPTLGANPSRPCVLDLNNDMGARADTREMTNPIPDRMAVVD